MVKKSTKTTKNTQKGKKLQKGAEFPRDFWNYNLNPITGHKSDIIVKLRLGIDEHFLDTKQR